jgi:hypothetical protein
VLFQWRHVTAVANGVVVVVVPRYLQQGFHVVMFLGFDRFKALFFRQCDVLMAVVGKIVSVVNLIWSVSTAVILLL